MKTTKTPVIAAFTLFHAQLTAEEKTQLEEKMKSFGISAECLSRSTGDLTHIECKLEITEKEKFEEIDIEENFFDSKTIELVVKYIYEDKHQCGNLYRNDCHSDANCNDEEKEIMCVCKDGFEDSVSFNLSRQMI